MPTTKYRLVEVIIHEGESANAGHYISVNLETKEVFNDQFTNKKYKTLKEYICDEASKLAELEKKKKKMKVMSEMSSEDVKDRLIKAGNIFYYRREAESFSNPVLETKSAENTPTISFKKNTEVIVQKAHLLLITFPAYLWEILDGKRPKKLLQERVKIDNMAKFLTDHSNWYTSYEATSFFLCQVLAMSSSSCMQLFNMFYYSYY